MNMQPYNQNSDEQRDGRMAEHELEQLVDTGLATFPVEPLPDGFTKSVMAAIANEPIADEPVAEAAPLLPISLLSRHNLLTLARIVYQGALSVRGQIRTADVLLAIFFAAFWCVLGASFIWTERIASAARMTSAQAEPLTWLIPISVLIGSMLAAGTLGLYVYMEKWNSEYVR